MNIRGTRSPIAILLSTLLPATIALAGDFDGDGFHDLAIGVPGQSVSGQAAAGVVHVVLGTAQGLGGPGQLLIDKTAFGAGFTALANDHFGSSVAVGDFDGDGFADLAIGCPDEMVGNVDQGGAVHVIRGSATGLDFVTVKTFTQATKNVADDPELGLAKERFGKSLAAGDFDGDGRDDLAIGVDEGFSGKIGAGAVHVLYGGKKGLKAKGSQFWTADSKKVKGKSAAGGQFGRSLAAGDFDGDGVFDLAIGSVRDASSVDGAVTVLFGTEDGLAGKGSRLFVPADLSVPAGASGSFGLAVAAVDGDGDGTDELAIASPDLSGGGVIADVVFVLGESSQGPVAGGTLALTGIGSGVALGRSLTAGDFNDDGHEELAIGAPLEDLGPVVDAGGAYVLRGTASGLTIMNAIHLFQGLATMPGTAAASDQLGHAVAAADFDGDGLDELAIGCPYDHVGADSVGRVHVLKGTIVGLLTAANLPVIQQGVNGFIDLAEAGEEFGRALGS